MDARGTSVLEDSLVGLEYMLGHLWCSTLQGQLQEERRQGKNLSLGLFSKGMGESRQQLEKRAGVYCMHTPPQAEAKSGADVR